MSHLLDYWVALFCWNKSSLLVNTACIKGFIARFVCTTPVKIESWVKMESSKYQQNAPHTITGLIPAYTILSPWQVESIASCGLLHLQTSLLWFNEKALWTRWSAVTDGLVSLLLCDNSEITWNSVYTVQLNWPMGINSTNS